VKFLALAWALAALILLHDARNVRDYLELSSALGLRGEVRVATPLSQTYPAFAADAQTWVRHALSLSEGNALRLRHTDIDNAPFGREVHWNSAWAWTIAGAGHAYQAISGIPYAYAVERATLWLNPSVLLALIMVVSLWVRRHLGLASALLVVAAMALHPRLIEGFYPSYVDHHGLLAISVLGTVLGAAAMMQGRREGAVFSALSGALGMWVSAASVLPAISFCATAAFVLRPPAEAARAWRLWGAVGAAASLAFYAVEYFPHHMAMRLEVNHPLYSIAWLAAGELVARRGELVPRDAFARAWPWILLAALPVTVLAGGIYVLSFTDPFVARLHSLYILEFIPLWTVLTKVHPEMGQSVLFTDAAPLFLALATIATWRRASPPALVFATLVTTALVGMGFWQSRWHINAGAGEVALLVVLVDAWTASRSVAVRAAAVAGAVALLFAPGAYERYSQVGTFVAKRHVETQDAAVALARDVAAAIRATQPQGDIIVLASPDASTQIGYYGRFKTLGTLYWENGDGLKAAAAMFSAGDDAQAERLLRGRHVTHIALVSRNNFIREYYRLLHPGATDAEVDRCFGWRLITGQQPPAWLERIPYDVPADLKVLRTSVLLFKVR
jgi:hypothetical protein